MVSLLAHFMTPDTRPIRGSTALLLILSGLLMALGLLGSLLLLLSPNDGGFFPGLGKGLALMLLATTNLLSWLLNLIAWWFLRRRWLGAVLALQTLPALIFAGLLAMGMAEGIAEGRAGDQRARIFAAIAADDVDELHEARQRCNRRCEESIGLQRSLLEASIHGSHEAARYLIAQGATTFRSGQGALEFHNAHRSLYTCEGSYLPVLNALEVSVARRDWPMMTLLWPVSDGPARQTALLTAARLDRLDMLQWMSTQGVTVDALTLLEAAVSGAAVETARWLLGTSYDARQPAAVQQALSGLIAFILEIETARSIELGQLLIRHGADLDAVILWGEPALQQAIRYRSSTLASQLLELGADPAVLGAQDRAALEVLLQTSPRPVYGRNRSGCVAP